MEIIDFIILRPFTEGIAIMVDQWLGFIAGVLFGALLYVVTRQLKK